MSLIDLQTELIAQRSNLSSQKTKLRDYKNKANALEKLYNRMKDKKENMIDMKKDMVSFANKEYNDWKGNVFDIRYQDKLENDLVDSKFTKIIDIIDDNLDAINTERTKYQNKILNTQGLIGRIEAAINSLVTKIENWFN